jgi:SAM-dependent methyltransferase
MGVRILSDEWDLTFDFEVVFEVDDYMYFYGDILTPELSKKQVEFLVRELNLKPPMKILDLACGFGRHSNLLAKMGFCVTGVDLMDGFLEIAKKEAEKLGVSVNYIKMDMREIAFEEEFDLVILLFTSFGYFSDRENLKVLINIWRALKKGGLFTFDIPNRDILIKNYLPYVVHEKEGNFLIDLHRFDPLTGRLYNKRYVIRDGEVKYKPFFVRLYNPTEIRDYLERAGFNLKHIYKNWDGEPFDSESQRMIIVAEKT